MGLGWNAGGGERWLLDDAEGDDHPKVGASLVRRNMARRKRG
jgi:hypothetical protein